MADTHLSAPRSVGDAYKADPIGWIANAVNLPREDVVRGLSNAGADD